MIGPVEPRWVEEVRRKVETGRRLDEEDVALLGQERHLLVLGMLADQARRQRHGTRTTFVRVAHWRLDEPLVTPPPAAREVRIVGHPDSLEAACTAVRAVRAIAGEVPVTGFSLAALDAWSGHVEARLFEALCRLREAGLLLIAEAPVDRLQDGAVLETVTRAGLRVARLTVENAPRGADRLAWVRRVASWGPLAAAAYAFAPLPRAVHPGAPSTGYEDVRLVALARLLVGEVASIQVDWSLHGPKLAQVALTFGADDLDNVSPVDDAPLGPRRAVAADVRRNIEAAALSPAERDGAFRIVPS